MCNVHEFRVVREADIYCDDACSIPVRSVWVFELHRVELGQVSLRTCFFPVTTIPQMLHSRLYLHIFLNRKINGVNLWTFFSVRIRRESRIKINIIFLLTFKGKKISLPIF